MGQCPMLHNSRSSCRDWLACPFAPNPAVRRELSSPCTVVKESMNTGARPDGQSGFKVPEGHVVSTPCPQAHLPGPHWAPSPKVQFTPSSPGAWTGSGSSSRGRRASRLRKTHSLLTQTEATVPLKNTVTHCCSLQNAH